MERMSTDSRDRVAKKCAHKDGNGLVAVDVIEHGQTLPSNARVRMRLRTQAKKRQINLARRAQRGELPGRSCHVAQDMPLDALPQALIHDPDGSERRR
jgi:hypothetical protein